MPSSHKIVLLDKGPLKRVLKVRDLFAVGYGDLGSSIYYALGMTALYALGATPIALMLAGLIFACTALTYAEMSSAFPDSGGSASFARHAFNDLISFIAGWGLLLDYIVTIAISAFAVGPYLDFLSPLFGQTSIQIGFTVGLIGVLFVINFLGVKHSTRISLFLVILTLATQVLIIILAFATKFHWGMLRELQINLPGADFSPNWSQFWKGTAMAMVAYTGIESIAQLGAETKEPSKSLPRAAILALFVLLFMYLGLSMAALASLPPKELGTTYLNNP
ncbi:MAG TPA: APC family permease, partial [Rhabdochlamydiaceae bacterium]|nr:APC family permease [Rhabdochlamydiaceae bacterium]